MATLIREERKVTAQENSTTRDANELAASIPTPFPRIERVAADAQTQPTISKPAQSASNITKDDIHSGVATTSHKPSHEQKTSNLLPSISQLEHSCLLTLNTLLSSSRPQFEWTPIIPPRRHSMPSPSTVHPTASGFLDHHDPFNDRTGNETAIQTLLGNLRNLAGEEEGMIELHTEQQDGPSVLRELQSRVHTLSTTMSESEAQLSRSLVSLLVHVERLKQLKPLWVQNKGVQPPLVENGFIPSSVYDDLNRQVSTLKAQRADTEDVDSRENASSTQEETEAALLWSRIDEDLETVSRLCRRRMRALDPFLDDASYVERDRHGDTALPPEYDHADFELPQYRMSHDLHLDEKHKEKRLEQAQHTRLSTTGSVQDEKMRLDFESVMMAIDRMYIVAPQLHNQRVELKKTKAEQLERASKAAEAAAIAGTSSQHVPSAQRSRSGSGAEEPRVKGKGKVRSEEQELDSMLSLIGKASSRRMNDQAVVLSDDLKLRLQRARMEDDEKRRQFVEQLVSHSDAGRLHNQDAVLMPAGQRIKDPEVLLTLPEFIREAVPPGLQGDRTDDPNALLTLPEFVKESQRTESQKMAQSQSEDPPSKSSAIKRKESKPRLKPRSKSFSNAAGAGAWILGKPWSRQMPPPPTSSQTAATSPSQVGLSISFVAEHQETLNVVILLFKITNSTGTPSQIVLEVVPSSSGASDEGNLLTGDQFLVKQNASWSPPLHLPARVLAGKHIITPMGEHYEIKLPTPPQSLDAIQIASSVPLMDAAQLRSISPSSFVCSSCSLPLVHTSDDSTGSLQYRDLPSDYWTELVDAWVCHHDQALSKRVSEAAQEGFWPRRQECLIGGSYYLLEESATIITNLRSSKEVKTTDDWMRVQCICGAAVGRCQLSPLTETIVYRFPKYATRPVSANARPLRIPLSAYVVEDMVELSQVHGAYRFVICDEEEEKARLLIWVFKPTMKLSYSAPNVSLIPRSGSVVAAKILFKVVGLGSGIPFDAKSTLEKHPNFSHAEQLSYPLDICRRLAGLLRESHSTYPSNRRTMSGLDAGWLQRW